MKKRKYTYTLSTIRHKVALMIRSRYRAGDTMKFLAEDYNLSLDTVRFVIRSKSAVLRAARRARKEWEAHAATTRAGGAAP